MTTPDDPIPTQSDAEAGAPKRRRFAPRRSRSAALQADATSLPAEGHAATTDPALNGGPGVSAGATSDAATEAVAPASRVREVAPSSVPATATTTRADAHERRPEADAAPAASSNPAAIVTGAGPVTEALAIAPEVPAPSTPAVDDAPPGRSTARRRARAKQPPAGATAPEPTVAAEPASEQPLATQSPAEENGGRKRPARRSRAASPAHSPVVEAASVAEEAPSVAPATDPEPAPAATPEAPRRGTRSRRSPGRRTNAVAALTEPSAHDQARDEASSPVAAVPASEGAGDKLHTQQAGATAALPPEPPLAPAEIGVAPNTRDGVPEAQASPAGDGLHADTPATEATESASSAVATPIEVGTSGEPRLSRYDDAPNGLDAGGDEAYTADLDGEDLLARAIRELFPASAEADETQADETGRFGSSYDAFADDMDALDDASNDVAALAALDGLNDDEGASEPLEGEDAAEAARRRGRRGRRGGRGRRRNGLVAIAGPQEETPDFAEATVTETPAAPIPIEGGEPPIELFQPEATPRPSRSWRDRGPRRQWGRTFSRAADTVQMPPPKPSNGARPGPIPQAAPPLAALAEPQVMVPHSVPFVLPDLGLDEPLEPGETRTERLLLAQTRLLQAMMEQQARQIEVLTASVAGLRQTVQQLGNARGYLPRTGIFVDAPNVCYAADNARVQIDYGRMLKYLSRDRELVHALSYAPITDDVHEGIRYETQRFVAPFLRTGYKMVTKPLKRFPDGSAKGNFDIELAVDIVTMSDRLDIVVLVSGDSDFEPMIELIQSRGVRVEVVAFASNVSTELVNVADVFIDISQHLEHMRPL